MPSPKKCALKFKKGSKAYSNCINYAGKKKPSNPTTSVKRAAKY